MRQNNGSRVDGHRLLDHLVRPVSEPRQQQGLRIRRAAYGLAERPGFLEIAAGERIKSQIGPRQTHLLEIEPDNGLS